MRLLLAAAIWLVCVGGLQLYMSSRAPVRATLERRFRKVSGAVAIEITPSFAAQPDPFALTTGTAAPAVLLVRVNGTQVLRRAQRVEGGRPLRVEPLEPFVEGTNELYLEASPPAAEVRAHAVRVRVLRDGVELADRSFWSEGSCRVVGTMKVVIRTTARAGDHDE